MNKIASAHAGNSSLIATLCLPVLMALALVALILFAGACSDDTAETEGLFPPQPVPESRNWLFTVYGKSENDIYAAGAKGATKAFIDRYNKAHGYVPDDVAALTWDALRLAQTAIESTGKLTGKIKADRKAVRDALAKVKEFHGIKTGDELQLSFQ